MSRFRRRDARTDGVWSGYSAWTQEDVTTTRIFLSRPSLREARITIGLQHVSSLDTASQLNPLGDVQLLMGYFKLQLDSSSSTDHPNVPDDEPHPCLLGGPARLELSGCPDLGGCVHCDTTQQRNTHIRDLREICYPWHPWHGRKVWVRASLVRRGRAVMYCCLEEVETCRTLEVPFWMLDVASCCKTRTSTTAFASVHALRELKEIVESAQQAPQAHDRPETQPRYLLDAGDADGGITGSAEIEPTSVVCSSAMQPVLDRSVVRCSTTDRATNGAVTEAASKDRVRGRNRRGGAL